MVDVPFGSNPPLGKFIESLMPTSPLVLCLLSIIHLVAIEKPNSRAWIMLRKTLDAVFALIWFHVGISMIAIDQWYAFGTTILIICMLLIVAILRRDYTTFSEDFLVTLSRSAKVRPSASPENE